MKKEFRGKKILKSFEWLATNKEFGFFKMKNITQEDAMVIIEDLLSALKIDVDFLVKALRTEVMADEEIPDDEDDDVAYPEEEEDDRFVNN